MAALKPIEVVDPVLLADVLDEHNFSAQEAKRKTQLTGEKHLPSFTWIDPWFDDNRSAGLEPPEKFYRATERGYIRIINDSKIDDINVSVNHAEIKWVGLSFFKGKGYSTFREFCDLSLEFCDISIYRC